MLLKVQKAVGTALVQDYVGYSYTANGRQASVTDADGNVATLRYDGFDRLAQWNFPSAVSAGQTNAGDYEAYGYDASGNRTSLRRRDGRVFTFGYDALDRMTSKIVPDGCAPIQSGPCPAASATRDVYYGYDVRNLPVFARFDGASGEGLTNSYELGRLTSATTNMGGASRTLTYQNDDAGNRTRITHPDSAYFAMTYDARGLMYHADLAAPGGGPVPFVQITYDALGRRTDINRASSYTAIIWTAPRG